MTNSTYTHVNKNNKKDNSFSEKKKKKQKKAIRQRINDLINRNFNMNKNKKKESLINNINTINSFSTGLKMKSKEAQSRNKSQITFKQLNGKELSFGVVDEKSGNENNNL